MKTMKAEIDTLKINVSSTLDIQKEGKLMMKMIKTLKESTNANDKTFLTR